MPKPVISVEHLTKKYDLGVIGTGTISRDLERWWARVRKETFLAYHRDLPHQVTGKRHYQLTGVGLKRSNHAGRVVYRHGHLQQNGKDFFRTLLFSRMAIH